MASNKKHRAPLGFALIARDAAQTLGRCLDTIRPYCEQIVVCVDELSRDDTPKVAKRHGADLVVPVQVSDWHECPEHGRVLAQHFARARNESFTHLDPSLDWSGWIDADDVLKGGERLKELLAGVPDDCIGVWMPYAYATMNDGAQINTLFDRERLLRANVGWEWEQRVHEVVKPKREGPWTTTKAAAIYHQEGAHRTTSSADRNQLLLEIDLEEDPNSSRATFYLANGYFAKGDMESAVEWYERLLEIGTNPYERWQSACYLSAAYERLGDPDAAEIAALRAIAVVPDHPEPYYRLASAALMKGEPDRALRWTQEGRTKKEPPFFVFKNPLDYTFNQRTVAADALAQTGRISEARKELEQAFAAMPDERVKGGIAHYQGIETAVEEGERFKAFAEYANDPALTTLRYFSLPRDVKGIRSVRDVVMPTLLARRPSTQPRIVFWCGRALEEWAPPTLEETGIGGSETAVVEIARRFASDGWVVDVYNGAGSMEGVYNGVGYWDPERWADHWAAQEVFVSWRSPRLGFVPNAHKTMLWCHDLNYGPQSDMAQWDRVLGVSQWHADMLKRYYGVDAGFVPNGIDLARFADPPKKKAWQAVYASSPDRGLLAVLHLWTKIAADEPGARLKVAYGWDNFDKMSGDRPDMQAFKAEVLRRVEADPRVEMLGRLPQTELAKLYGESVAWLYPTTFLEVSCISAMEAMAGGCVPVTSAAGALKETIGLGEGCPGVVIPGQPHSAAWQDFYVASARAVLGDPGINRPLAHAGRERAKAYTWDAAYERWKGIVERLLTKKEEKAA